MCELPRWSRMAFRGVPDPDLQLLRESSHVRRNTRNR